MTRCFDSSVYRLGGGGMAPFDYGDFGDATCFRTLGKNRRERRPVLLCCYTLLVFKVNSNDYDCAGWTAAECCCYYYRCTLSGGA